MRMTMLAGVVLMSACGPVDPPAPPFTGAFSGMLSDAVTCGKVFSSTSAEQMTISVVEDLLEIDFSPSALPLLCGPFSGTLSSPDSTLARVLAKTCPTVTDGSVEFTPSMQVGTLQVSGNSVALDFSGPFHVYDASSGASSNCTERATGLLARN